MLKSTYLYFVRFKTHFVAVSNQETFDLTIVAFRLFAHFAVELRGH